MVSLSDRVRARLWSERAKDRIAGLLALLAALVALSGAIGLLLAWLTLLVFGVSALWEVM